MSGIYISLLQASVSLLWLSFRLLKRKEEMVLAYKKKSKCAKKEFQNDTIDYLFWGGTPSVLTSDEINFLIDSVYENYEVDENPEITRSQSGWFVWWTNIRIIKSKINALASGFNRSLRMIWRWWTGHIIRRKPKMFRGSDQVFW
jgi:oxygen-independent coproporphyrinogen-3 oxidase